MSNKRAQAQQQSRARRRGPTPKSATSPARERELARQARRNERARTRSGRTARQQWTTRIAVLALLLAVGEVGARVFDKQFSDAAASVSGNVSDRIKAMKAEGSRGKCIDIAIVGSSITFAGLDTQEMAAAWPEKPAPSTYNAALQSFSVAVWPKWIDQHVMPLLHPRNVVLSLDTGLDWAQKGSTPLYRQDFAHLEVRAGRTDSGLGQVSALYRNRGALRHLNVAFSRGNRPEGGFPGLTAWGTFPPFAELPSFHTASDGIEPRDLIEKAFTQRLTGFSQLDGEEALGKAIDAARKQGAHVFVLDPPTMRITNLTDEELATRSALLATRRERITAIARIHGAQAIHLSDELDSPQYWSDLHFNAWGSQRAITELSKVLIDNGVDADPACSRSSTPTTSGFEPMPTARTSDSH